MTRELITTHTDYLAASLRLFRTAQQTLSIFDADGKSLNLEDSQRISELQRFLQSANRPSCLRLAVRDGNALKREHPRLLRLAATYGHLFTMQQIAPSLGPLRDSMILVDGCHGLIRFDERQPRSKLLVDEADELRPYYRRFDEIWQEQGEIITATTLGL